MYNVNSFIHPENIHDLIFQGMVIGSSNNKASKIELTPFGAMIY